MNTGRFSAGANGRLSRYPFAALVSGNQGIGLGIDMDQPAFFRAGYNAASKELFLAYDIALVPEKSKARLRFCKFTFLSRDSGCLSLKSAMLMTGLTSVSSSRREPMKHSGMIKTVL
jgi:hypothetical protein